MPTRGLAIGLLWLSVVLALRLTVVRAAGPPVERPPDRRSIPVTLAERYRQVQGIAPPERSRREIALLTGLEFCLLMGVTDGQRAARLVDVVGYQPLPLVGDLPEDPPRPLRPEQVHDLIERRPESNVDDAPAGCFRLVDRDEVRTVFPAVADWMLPRDYALLLSVPPSRIRHWISEGACLVIRIRGRRATIVAGNLFAALSDTPRAAPPARLPAESSP